METERDRQERYASKAKSREDRGQQPVKYVLEVKCENNSNFGDHFKVRIYVIFTTPAEFYEHRMSRFTKMMPQIKHAIEKRCRETSIWVFDNEESDIQWSKCNKRQKKGKFDLII